MEGVDYLAQERNKAGFDVNAMKIVWYGSQRNFDISDRMSKLVASDPVCLSLSLSLVSIFYVTSVVLWVCVFRWGFTLFCFEFELYFS